MTCRPVPTARASRPSRIEPAISAIARLTRSGTTSPSPVGVSISFFWYFLVTAVPCRWGLGGRPAPTSRLVGGGGRHPNFFETPGNLGSGGHERSSPPRPAAREAAPAPPS